MSARSLLVLLAVPFLVAPGGSVQICENYPQPDPCKPGGKWDPVLNSCAGYEGRECYQCYSGPFCQSKESVLKCKFDCCFGNPLYLAEYWTSESSVDPCTSTLGDYRPSYQANSSQDSNIAFSPLLSAIKELHSVTENAVTEGYHVIAGIGSTMVINVAVAVVAEKLLESCSGECPDHIDVFSQTPHYGAYPFMMKYIPGVKWNINADPLSPWTIEILTYPNNPDGAKRRPLVTNPDRVVMDMVYYWPMYTEIDQTMDKPIMIFSSSKHDGLAGTRFGWGLVKDDDVAQRMYAMLSAITMSQSVDIELRILTSMQAILNMKLGADELLPFHSYGRAVMSSRFKLLKEALDSLPHLTLQNSLESTGAYAWIHCNGTSTCTKEFDKINVTGFSGTRYGTSDQDIRFTMMLPSVEFDILLGKVKMLQYFKSY